MLNQMQIRRCLCCAVLAHVEATNTGGTNVDSFVSLQKLIHLHRNTFQLLCIPKNRTPHGISFNARIFVYTQHNYAT